MSPFLEERNDLGLHTEVISSGILELVNKGIINGKYKTVNKGKAVATDMIAPPEEIIEVAKKFVLYSH